MFSDIINELFSLMLQNFHSILWGIYKCKVLKYLNLANQMPYTANDRFNTKCLSMFSDVQRANIHVIGIA